MLQWKYFYSSVSDLLKKLNKLYATEILDFSDSVLNGPRVNKWTEQAGFPLYFFILRFRPWKGAKAPPPKKNIIKNKTFVVCVFFIFPIGWFCVVLCTVPCCFFHVVSLSFSLLSLCFFALLSFYFLCLDFLLSLSPLTQSLSLSSLPLPPYPSCSLSFPISPSSSSLLPLLLSIFLILAALPAADD